MVGVESKPGEGSIFYFVLPLQPTPGPDQPTPPRAAVAAKEA